MTNANHPTPTATAADDPIRIVPLHAPTEIFAPVQELPSAPKPALTYRGGPLLGAVEVFTVFWGAAWNEEPQKTLADQLNAFFQFVLTSSLLTTQMAEYSVPGQSIGAGKFIGTATLTGPALKHSVTDTAIRRMLQHETGAAGTSHLPKPGPNVLYFVYLPPGVAVVQGGSRSCQAFCGYHDAINGQLFYAAMPYGNCQGCLGGLPILDAMTSTSSHELCEAITDAVPGKGWYDDTHGEIGDICAWKTKKLGQYTVQLEWSNQAGKCV